jgi:hypothetical protein
VPTTDARVARTHAATTTNRQRAARRAAQQAILRLDHLDDEHLLALAAVVVTEARDRGLAVRYLP